ncbi:alpha/beta fold hydrolase [Sporosarcina cyprini]|uniref:alpha/beta fold hydrolase n=1 Tax=Sporosarcina cyprini TaxID=2910523 RepID=UPI001EDDDDE6|nr:alpha/beta hydrolase [Sporosarcina cyprini]MCG3088386.1 alpha/beta hydrolase [Sporosarcina cyprini]
MPNVTINNASLHYEFKGEGSITIVFTHGASWDSGQWRDQVEFFSKDYQTIVWDVRGHGCSTLPEGKVDSEDFTADLIGLLDHLGVEKAVLCGLSLGGHISLQAAVRHPERVAALILIGTPFTNRFNWFERIAVPINRWSNRFIPMATLAKLQANALSKYNPANRMYIEDTVGSIPHADWLRLWDAISRMESKDDLEKVVCPTLILYGEHDSMIKRQQQYLAKAIKDARLVSIENAHHATNLDNTDQVNECIERFLNESGVMSSKL